MSLASFSQDHTEINSFSAYIQFLRAYTTAKKCIKNGYSRTDTYRAAITSEIERYNCDKVDTR